MDPTARISKGKLGRDVERDRVLSEAELIQQFQKMPAADLAATTQLALLLKLSNATRIGEVLGARWEHVDFERRQWTLPETKNGKRQVIWLSDFAMARMRQLDALTGLTPWLFPASRARDGEGAYSATVCAKTVTKQVGDRQSPGDKPMSGRTRHVDGLVLAGGLWTPPRSAANVSHAYGRNGGIAGRGGAMPESHRRSENQAHIPACPVCWLNAECLAVFGQAAGKIYELS